MRTVCADVVGRRVLAWMMAGLASLPARRGTPGLAAFGVALLAILFLTPTSAFAAVLTLNADDSITWFGASQDADNLTVTFTPDSSGGIYEFAEANTSIHI